LKGKCDEQESNIGILSEEIERQSEENETKERKIEELVKRCEIIKRESQVRLEETRYSYEAEAKIAQEEWTKDMMNQKEEYEGQVNSLREAIMEYEKNLNLMVDEVEKLTTVVDEKEQELEGMTQRSTLLERQKEQEIQDLKKRSESEKKQAVEKEAKDFMNRLNSEKGVFEVKIREANVKLMELQKTITLLNNEIDRVTGLCEEKENEIGSWRDRYHDLDNLRCTEIEEITTQFETLKRNSLQSGDYEIRLQAERSAHETQVMQMRQKIAELETEIGDLMKDNERINVLYLQKKKEIDILKSSHGALESGTSEELTQLRKENENLKRLITETSENLNSVTFDKSAHESKISQLQQSLELHRIEIVKLHDVIHSRKAENDSLTNELSTARTDLDRNVKAYKELEAEYLKLVSSYENLYREVGDLKNSRDLYKVQCEQNNMDIAKKNKELLDKLAQVDALKAKYEEAITNYEPIKTTTKTTVTRTLTKK